MLQLSALHRRAIETLDVAAAGDLEREADRRIAALRTRRRELARTPWERFGAWLDQHVRTDAVESLDRPDHPERRKLQQVRWLHVQNVLLRSSARYVEILRPSIEDAAHARRGERVRVLELACGSGDLTFALADELAYRGLPADIVGSDVVRGYIERASQQALARRSPVRFRRLDALRLASAIEPGEVDVVFLAQSAHHFTPGQLARMMAEALAAGGRHFVVIDGHRSLRLLAALTALGALTLDRDFARDGIISARRFYSEPELRTIAELACPGARIATETAPPLTSVLRVERVDGSAS